MNAVCESIDANLDARDRPLLSVRGLTRLYGPEKGCQEVDFDLYPGEVLGIVGESGSGKSTLLSLLSGRCPPDAGTVAYRDDGDRWLDLYAASEAERRTLLRTEWGFVEQNPRDGLRMGVSAGANIGERLMAQGVRHYGRLRQAGLDWLEQVEIDPLRIDDLPRTFSGGMQQRLQIARNLVSAPRLVFMDEPTGGLDVSVQARLLDLLRGLVRELDLAVVIVTHDLAVARLLADRLMVMRRSRWWKPVSPTRFSTTRSIRTRNCWCRRSCNPEPKRRRRSARRAPGEVAMNNLIEVRDLSKTFTLHQQQGVVLNVLRGLNFNVAGGECLVLHGRSGAGKSTLLRTLYGNYLPAGGSIRLRHAGDWLELVGAEPREVLAVRRQTLGYVSQFLRVIPRVATLDVVMEPALARGWSRDSAELRARSLLARLNIPERLWQLAPGTFSGGEQQRVNIARGFMVEWPILLLDEPTASLDEANRQVVLELIGEAKAAGAALIGIFHDRAAREAVASRYLDMSQELSRQEQAHVV